MVWPTLVVVVAGAANGIAGGHTTVLQDAKILGNRGQTSQLSRSAYRSKKGTSKVREHLA